MKGKLLRSLRLTFVVFAFSVLGYASFSVVRYARTAPRFEVEQLSVSGLRRVAENDVLSHAGLEIGTNVFAVDLDDLRMGVEQIPWVRYALVERVLPDQIVIKVVEREPIGLARIRGITYQFDVDAMLLDTDAATTGSFPVLDGLTAADEEGNLRKVSIYQRVLEELGETELSEIRIDDSGDVSVVSSSDPLMVGLGAGDFRARWIKYLQLKTQIQQQYPSAVRVDLRFRNQVIVRMTEDESGEQVIWGAEKKTL